MFVLFKVRRENEESAFEGMMVMDVIRLFQLNHSSANA